MIPIGELAGLNELLEQMLKVDMTTRRAVPAGTFPPGSRVRKNRVRPGDIHQVGALARTLSFPLGPVVRDGREIFGYFVQWDDLPGLAVFVAGDVLELWVPS